MKFIFVYLLIMREWAFICSSGFSQTHVTPSSSSLMLVFRPVSITTFTLKLSLFTDLFVLFQCFLTTLN